MSSIAEKANKILHILLIILLLIALRLWFLTIIKSDSIREEALKPRQRTSLVMAPRATLRDRFNVPLAVNKMSYQAAIVYAHFFEVPLFVWEQGENGARVKRYKRKEHIYALANLLSEVLEMDSRRLVDLIYAKAALYQQRPFVVKENLTEQQYYQLKAAEREWPGLQVMRVPQRYYPRGKVAADVIGYMGAINRQEYEAIIGEIAALESFLSEWEEGMDPSFPEGMEHSQQVADRLRDLQEKAYTLNDRIGKAGAEAYCEESLRGFHGKNCYVVDARGNILSELPGSHPPIPGHRVLLTLSAELQEYVEKLLIQNERVRDGRSTLLDRMTGIRTPLKEPWIKGGAVVVMDPHNGDILAMASHPRYDPNDFAGGEERAGRVHQWMEDGHYLAELWDQKRFLEREDCIGGELGVEAVPLTWEAYLDLVLDPTGEVKKEMGRLDTVGAALALQRQPLSEEETYESLLIRDLCSLAVAEERFSQDLSAVVGNKRLEAYRQEEGVFHTLEAALKKMAKDFFHEETFQPWRQEHEKAFLKEKRKEEKANKKYARPYLDHLDKKEQEMFQNFWELYRWELVQAFLLGMKNASNTLLQPYMDYFSLWCMELAQGAHAALEWYSSYSLLKEALSRIPQVLVMPYLHTFRSYQELDKPLFGHYTHLRNENGQQLQKHLAAAFYPQHGFGYFRSHAYRQATAQGSIFKLVTAYEALIQRYQEIGDNTITLSSLNPFEMIDSVRCHEGKWQVGSFLDGTVIPRSYKGGTLPRSARNNLGRVDIVRALEISSNPYFSLLAGDFLKNPDDLLHAAKQFSYGAKTGIELPGEIAGSLPEDLSCNRTGLYAFAIGQHRLSATPLQAAVMLSALANGGIVLKPHVIKLTAGKGFYSTEEVNRKGKEEVRSLLMPEEIRHLLLLGMKGAFGYAQTLGSSSLEKIYHQHPEAMKDFYEMKTQLIGKSSTSEIVEAVGLEPDRGLHTYTHVWFGGISFEQHDDDSVRFVAKDPFGKPELVVIVYLRFGGFGKDVMPVAAQIIKKWREIKTREKV